jgi:hypothetical protein
MILDEWIMSPVMGNNRTPRANPKKKGNINPFTIRESVEEIQRRYGKRSAAKNAMGQ